MTQPNTEPKPATDARVEEIRAILADVESYDLDPGDYTIMECLARIEQEREMREEATDLIWAALIAAKAVGNHGFAEMVEGFLARAAKMEADYAK